MGPATRGGRIRRLAGRLRDVDAAEAMGRWNELLGELGAEVEAANARHRRAVETHANGTRTLFDDVNEVLEAVTAAAARRAVLGAAQDNLVALRAWPGEAASRGGGGGQCCRWCGAGRCRPRRGGRTCSGRGVGTSGCRGGNGRAGRR